jgi:hypothetical protein
LAGDASLIVGNRICFARFVKVRIQVLLPRKQQIELTLGKELVKEGENRKKAKLELINIGYGGAGYGQAY